MSLFGRRSSQTQYETCRRCKNNPIKGREKCGTCGGEGRLDDGHTALYQRKFKDCGACRGTKAGGQCIACGGSQLIEKK